MSRDEVLEVMEITKNHVSYKYEHREEYNEALAIARFDVRAIQELIKINEGNLSDSEKEQEIRRVMASAKRIAG